MECMNKCGAELTGRQRTFCSDKCRMEHKRANRTPQDCAGLAKSNKPEQGVTRTKSNATIRVRGYSRKELELAIRSYPHDTWVNSPEHKELMDRLRSMTVDELEADGYCIPAWKRIA